MVQSSTEYHHHPTHFAHLTLLYFTFYSPYFEGMVGRIYPPELQLNKANASDTEAPFLGFTFIYFKRVCFIQNL